MAGGIIPSASIIFITKSMDSKSSRQSVHADASLDAIEVRQLRNRN